MNNLESLEFKEVIRAISIPSHHKIFPPYGKKIDEIRRAGMMPALRVIVSTRWEIGKAYPRIIVTGDMPMQNVEFKYLAGLSVQIVHFNSDGFIDELVDAIRCCNPWQLCLFNMDNVATGQPALKIIEPRHAKETVNA
jgi:hypothetical protein